MISYDDFQNIELRVAKILAAERVPGSEKLLKLRIGLEAEERQIIAGIGKRYEPEKLIGREVDLVERAAIEQSENYIRRKSILRHLETLYAA